MNSTIKQFPISDFFPIRNYVKLQNWRADIVSLTLKTTWHSAVWLALVYLRQVSPSWIIGYPSNNNTTTVTTTSNNSKSNTVMIDWTIVVTGLKVLMKKWFSTSWDDCQLVALQREYYLTTVVYLQAIAPEKLLF